VSALRGGSRVLHRLAVLSPSAKRWEPVFTVCHRGSRPEMLDFLDTLRVLSPTPAKRVPGLADPGIDLDIRL